MKKTLLVNVLVGFFALPATAGSYCAETWQQFANQHGLLAAPAEVQENTARFIFEATRTTWIVTIPLGDWVEEKQQVFALLHHDRQTITVARDGWVNNQPACIWRRVTIPPPVDG